MENPVISFFAAFAIWFGFLWAFGQNADFKKNEISQTTLEIEASSFGEIVETARKFPGKKPSEKQIKKQDLDKSSDLKQSKEAAPSHDHHFLENAKNLKNQKEQSVTNAETKNKNQNKNLWPLLAPLPKIPDELRYEAFNSNALARFYISPEGKVLRVELLEPCAHPKLNHLLLKSLSSWRFIGDGSNRIQDIRVNFLVK